MSCTGHSSHHPRPIEIYNDKLVLYGCGDFIDDYEGIAGYEQYRPDLRFDVPPDAGEGGTGGLLRLVMVPLQAGKMRLRHAHGADTTLRRFSPRPTYKGLSNRF